MKLAFSLGLYEPPKIETILDIDAKYILPIKTKFLKHFENLTIDYNENIDAIFYDKKAFASFMMECETALEKTWKTRILFESTTRGNIIMFYDAYKLGFSFYCDQKTISYDILNAAAMKYVILFRCRHFFIDESVVAKEHTSPFIKIHFTDEPPKNKQADKSAFAKLRNYSMNHPTDKQKLASSSSTSQASNMFSNLFGSKIKNDSVGQTNKPDEKTVEKMKNKFIYLGKIHNCKLSQPAPKKRKVLAKFSSPLLENIKLDSSNLQRECMSYSDFKKSLVKTTAATVETTAATAT